MATNKARGLGRRLAWAFRQWNLDHNWNYGEHSLLWWWRQAKFAASTDFPTPQSMRTKEE